MRKYERLAPASVFKFYFDYLQSIVVRKDYKGTWSEPPFSI
jgi:hypothetical protein